MNDSAQAVRWYLVGFAEAVDLLNESAKGTEAVASVAARVTAMLTGDQRPADPVADGLLLLIQDRFPDLPVTDLLAALKAVGEDLA